ncbi:LOW QUALITY PROTEIN: hypothetical protein U9M48_034771, partial [Paspalum notatum var. saurae]
MAFPYNWYMPHTQGFPLIGDTNDDDDLDIVAAYAMAIVPMQQEEVRKSRYSVPRIMVRRDINEAWLRLHRDFFGPNPVYPDSYFRRMYRMSIRLFRRIADAVTAYDDYFPQGTNAALKEGSHPYQKILVSLKILAMGCTPFSIDREFSISRSVIDKSFKKFIRAVLRAPTPEDIQALLHTAEQRGFPDMLGSIDCMHWAWEKCPVGWQGEHIGHVDKPTLILEAVAGPNLWIWHAFFGMPGSMNDINVLHRSPVFDDIASGNAPPVSYVVNGNQYDMGYYLADGIYPDWATLIKGVSAPTTDQEKLFTTKQSAYRKDVERAFGVLQAKFKIVKGPAQLMKTRDLEYAMRCCIILQNMAAEDEQYQPLPRTTTMGLHHNFYHRMTHPFNSSLKDTKKIECKATHRQLQQDLMEHVHPNETGVLTEPASIASRRTSSTRSVAAASPAEAEPPAVLTVWRKSLLFGCDGFTVFDAGGDLAFRVDCYAATRRRAEVVLMDAVGKPLLTVRRSKRLLSLAERCWVIYDGDAGEGDGAAATAKPLLSVRRHVSLLRAASKSKQALLLAHVTPLSSSGVDAPYVVEGSYGRRACAVRDARGDAVAEVMRKESVGDDVFRLVANPGLGAPLAMGLVIALDEMFPPGGGSPRRSLLRRTWSWSRYYLSIMNDPKRPGDWASISSIGQLHCMPSQHRSQM